MKKKLTYFSISLLLLILGGCSQWVYRIDVPQGNYIEQRDVDKLRLGMNRAQVIYVLGEPVAKSLYPAEQWRYLYILKRGKGGSLRKTLTLKFTDGKLTEMLSDDFEKPAKFEEGIDQ